MWYQTAINDTKGEGKEENPNYGHNLLVHSKSVEFHDPLTKHSTFMGPRISYPSLQVNVHILPYMFSAVQETCPSSGGM